MRGALSCMEVWCDAGGCVVGWGLGGVENSYMSVKKSPMKDCYVSVQFS